MYAGWATGILCGIGKNGILTPVDLIKCWAPEMSPCTGLKPAALPLRAPLTTPEPSPLNAPEPSPLNAPAPRPPNVPAPSPPNNPAPAARGPVLKMSTPFLIGKGNGTLIGNGTGTMIGCFFRDATTAATLATFNALAIFTAPTLIAKDFFATRIGAVIALNKAALEALT